MSTWRKVCLLDEIPALGARVISTQARDIAVFRTADESVFAVEDHCPHKGGPLSEGIVFDHKVACPLHGLVVDLDIAEACAASDVECVRRFPVIVTDGGNVWILLDEAQEDQRRVADSAGAHILVQS